MAADILAEQFEEELSGSVAERAAADREWTYGHLVVDEAQELSPMDWRVLLRRCPTRSITAVGDLAQRSAPAGSRDWAGVFGPALGDRWTHRALTVNYRTPAEFMDAAAEVLPAHQRHLVPRSVRHADAPPRRLPLDPADPGGQLASVIAEERAAAGGTGTMAVITLDPATPPVAGVAVHTPGSAKGLEFDVVVVVGPDAIAQGCAADLYVAMTRATRRLVLLG